MFVYTCCLLLHITYKRALYALVVPFLLRSYTHHSLNLCYSYNLNVSYKLFNSPFLIEHLTKLTKDNNLVAFNFKMVDGKNKNSIAVTFMAKNLNPCSRIFVA